MMLAALGSPVRSPLPRTPRSAPPSPLPIGNIRSIGSFNLNPNYFSGNFNNYSNIAATLIPSSPVPSSPSSSAFATPNAGPLPLQLHSNELLSPSRLFVLAPLDEEPDTELPAAARVHRGSRAQMGFGFTSILAPAPAAPAQLRLAEGAAEERAAAGEGPIAAAAGGHAAGAAAPDVDMGGAFAAALQRGALPDLLAPLAALGPAPLAPPPFVNVPQAAAAAAAAIPDALLQPEDPAVPPLHPPPLHQQPQPVAAPVPAAAPAAAAAAPAAVAAAVAEAPAAAAAQPPPPAPAPPAPRKRDPETDLEPGVWELPPAEGGEEGKGAEGAAEPKMSEPVMVFLRSVISAIRTRVSFANESSRAVTAYWVDYNGQEIPYGSLKPKQAKIYDTYASHPWLFRCSETGDRMVVGGRMVHYAQPPRPAAPEDSLGLALGLARPAARKEPRVVITEAPFLEHSRATHAAFPAAYRAACRTLLLAHQRRQRPDLAAAAASAAAERATVADVMCRLFRNAVSSMMAAAQPAMLAMSVCSPTPPHAAAASAISAAASATARTPATTTTASSDFDTCARAVGRWLDGAALHTEPEEERGEDASSSSNAAAAAAATDVAVAGSTAAAAAAATPASGSQLRAPGQVRMSPEQLAASRGEGCRRQQLRDVQGEVAAAAAAGGGAGAAQRSLGDLLADLPLDLVHHILHLMAPPVRQHVALHPAGHPDILPALLPSNPATWNRPVPAGEQANDA